MSAGHVPHSSSPIPSLPFPLPFLSARADPLSPPTTLAAPPPLQNNVCTPTLPTFPAFLLYAHLVVRAPPSLPPPACAPFLTLCPPAGQTTASPHFATPRARALPLAPRCAFLPRRLLVAAAGKLRRRKGAGGRGRAFDPNRLRIHTALPLGLISRARLCIPLLSLSLSLNPPPHLSHSQSLSLSLFLFLSVCSFQFLPGSSDYTPAPLPLAHSLRTLWFSPDCSFNRHPRLHPLRPLCSTCSFFYSRVRPPRPPRAAARRMRGVETFAPACLKNQQNPRPAHFRAPFTSFAPGALEGLPSFAGPAPKHHHPQNNIGNAINTPWPPLSPPRLCK